jgi:hypothetical protein
MTLSLEQAAINLAAAVVLGPVIGCERQRDNRLAGPLTNALVALGAANFVVFSDLVPGDGSPTRVAAQVVSGIGFLGVDLSRRVECARPLPVEAAALDNGDRVVPYKFHHAYERRSFRDGGIYRDTVACKTVRGNWKRS